MALMALVQHRQDVDESVDRALRQLAPQVRTWMARYLGPGPDLDDATQDALIEIADALDRFEGRSKLTTYARRIALRVAIRHRRRHRKEPPALMLVDAQNQSPRSESPERTAIDRQSVAALYQALDRLPKNRRRAFILCDVERLHHDEAAAVEGVSRDTLRKRLTRARASLRKDKKLSALLEARS